MKKIKIKLQYLNCVDLTSRLELLGITEIHMIIFQVEIQRCEMYMREKEVEVTVVTVLHISVRYVSEKRD